ncbi:UDP-N-acetylmuramoyl-tripeptide--D-alanyl-D-alanine ligase [Oceanobacillus limi]|uniref:UDP-N-acetylmuramoyl-tripeptide--D-alanyl-D-alanine ligase n=1 Tax=Oceanobacillus limi TaxID=930131 RepID=A0A1I0DDE3_9BACI|nr:UDP-N-acetylmuramoyl-tripeptide--D-alanyl-D-alanine ligase [Oceanobacillus limi]SET30328.1 UDP-N-acetylmuramoyl-tripeptide--D-alanyl-D-alanine ligase [Oceanobacillus limi]
MLFTTHWMTSIFPNYRGDAQETISIDEITTDSRKKVNHSLFIPIIGDKFDGHKFLEQAIKHGAVATLWSVERDLPEFLPKDFPIFMVEDTVVALQKLANAYRHEINPIVIGITGSNGKTSTKDLVSTVLKSTYRTHFTQGNLNNHLGVPRTILSMGRETEVLVLEMGMNHFGEIELLSNIAEPDYAVITNIGESHIEHLGSREGIAKAKLEIVSGLKDNGRLILDGDERLLQDVQEREKVITCGFQPHNDVTIKNAEVRENQTKFNLDEYTYTIPLLGSHQAQNASYAITLGKLMKIDPETIKESLHNLKMTSMRFEMIIGKNDVSIINDAYNASPTSMKAAIEVIKQMDEYQEKIVILGDIFELGTHSEALHRSVADVIDEQISAILTVGNDSKFISDAAKEKNKQIVSKHYHTKESLIDDLKSYLKKDTLLLFKASRGMEFESIIKEIK